MSEIQEKCNKAKHLETMMNIKCAMLEQELEKEKETLRVWTSSGKKVQ